MILFDIDRLEQKLRNGDLSDKEVFNYLLAIVIATSLFSYASPEGYESKWLISLEMVLSTIFMAAGAWFTFHINKSGDNQDYFRRYLSLSVVVFVRTALLMIGLMIPVLLIQELLDKGGLLSTFHKDLTSILVVLGANGLFIYLLINAFRRVSRQEALA